MIQRTYAKIQNGQVKLKQKLLKVSIGFLVISNCAISQCRLDIEITELKNNKGVVMLQLFDENQKVIGQEKKAIENNKSSVAFRNIKPGKYGLRFFHDGNLSGILETNLFGKPVEGYGFSNNVTGKFGPPPFEKWLFEIREDKRITLKTVY
jgi:uncharacterized protein (DUF2141 family)